MRVTGVKRPPEVPCPRCRRMTVFSQENPWRPFCSERCKLADFGAWASESYRVEADAPPDDDPQQPPLRGAH